MIKIELILIVNKNLSYILLNKPSNATLHANYVLPDPALPANIDNV